MREIPQNLTGIRIHPPVLTLLHVIAAFLLGSLLPLPVQASSWMRLAGAGLVIAGLALALSAVNQFRRAGTTLDPHGGTTLLITTGPYCMSRNPIYIGYVCFLAGFPLIFESYWGLGLSPLLVLLMNRLVIQYEEAYLERLYNQDYLDFKSRVRRWL